MNDKGEFLVPILNRGEEKTKILPDKLNFEQKIEKTSQFSIFKKAISLKGKKSKIRLDQII